MVLMFSLGMSIYKTRGHQQIQIHYIYHFRIGLDGWIITKGKYVSNRQEAVLARVTELIVENRPPRKHCMGDSICMYII